MSCCYIGSANHVVAGQDNIFLDGQPISFSEDMGQPVVLEERMYVPVRAMADSFGYETHWNEQTRTVGLTSGEKATIVFYIGSPRASVNKEEVFLDVRGGEPFLDTKAQIRGGRTYVPLRFILENFGCSVNYESGKIEIRTNKRGPISPQAYQAMLGRGMDVDWSKTAEGKENYNVQAVKEFKKNGISHVRIRVKDKANQALFQTLEEQISDCLQEGLIPVIAYQADELKKEPTDENIQKVVEWWGKVAGEYRKEFPLLAFDIMIEGTDGLNQNPELVNELYERVVTEIRKTNPTRIVMISPRLRSDAAYLQELKIPSEHNGYLMAEWHFYAAGPSKTNERKLWTTGTAAEKQLILDKINLALEWQKKTGVPTWVGAWMPGNYNDGNDYTIEEQVAFATFMKEELEKAGIPFAVNSDTKFYNRETNEWVAEMDLVRMAIFGK